jgi:methyl-accepting chemotaxis protein
MNSIAVGASQQADEISQSVQYLNNLASSINSAESSINSVSKLILNTKKLSEDAGDSVMQLKMKARETSQVSKNIVENINTLNYSMQEIQSIITLIVKIADQTNLLSLNASIEAARAGESGKGFAVVAGEMKVLADQSKISTVKINKIIEDIKSKTQVTVNAAANADAIVNNQMQFMLNTENAFLEIITSMECVSQKMNIAVDCFKDTFILKNNSMDAMQNISAVSEETAATTEQVSCFTIEQKSGIETLISRINNLNDVVVELRQSISVFKL